MESNNQNGRAVKLFKHGRNQAIRLLGEFELPGDTAILRREGNRLVIGPLERPSLRALFASWEPLPDGLLPFEDLPAELVDL